MTIGETYELADAITDEDWTGIKEELGAVSYTHLRAHETVLDLVCRLLLEKKNNTHVDNSEILDNMSHTTSQVRDQTELTTSETATH